MALFETFIFIFIRRITAVDATVEKISTENSRIIKNININKFH